MNVLAKLLRNGRREWRLAEVRLLLLALVVAIMAVTSVSFFTDRVNRAMRTQATGLLGADLVIQSSRPIPDEYETSANALNLHTATTIEFPSVALAGEATHLSQVKAASAAYPLRGNLETTASRSTQSEATQGIPNPGEAWAEQRILQQLDIQVGEKFHLGNSEFTLSRIITFEPDRGGSAFQLAPRILINLQDLEKTGLLTPASRATFRKLIAGDAEKIERYRRQIKPKLQSFERLQTLDDGRPEVTSALQRGTRFMSLASLLTVILAGAAVALSAYSFSHKETQAVAILRSLGATRRQIYVRYGLRALMLIMLATIIGSLMGFGAQIALSEALKGWLNATLPAPQGWPLLVGFGTAALTLLGFALPSLLQLINTPPMRILRAETSAPPVSVWLTLFTISSALLLLLSWQAGDLKLAVWVFVGSAGALLAMLIIAWIITSLLRQLPSRGGTGWRLGITTIARFSRRSTLLIAVFGIGFLTLMLLSGVRTDLMKTWEDTVPADAPNHFLVNIQAEQLAPLKDFFTSYGIDQLQLYPMVRGRLTAINEKKVSAETYTHGRAKRLIDREFFVSTSHELPKANKVISGEWFSPEDLQGLSVEEGIAETLGLKIGDQLSFDFAGQTVSSNITSLREVKWDTMQPNFFIITAPGLLDNIPATYITSIRIDTDDHTFITELIKKFPSVTVLDVRAILNQVRRIIEQASRAVEYVFLFTLIAGIVVLLAAVQTQRAERRQEIAVLKTLGASSRQIRNAVASEFLLLGGIAGLLGSSLAALIGWILAQQVFNLDYQLNGLLLLSGCLGGSLLLGTVGLLVIHKIINTSPMRLLQES